MPKRFQLSGKWVAVVPVRPDLELSPGWRYPKGPEIVLARDVIPTAIMVDSIVTYAVRRSDVVGTIHA